MVVLDQDCVVEADPMVDASSGADGELLQHAESRRGLASIGDRRPGPLDGFDERSSRRGDAREAPDEVERNPLGGEDRDCGPGDRGERRTGGDASTIVDMDDDGDRRVDVVEARPRHLHPGDGAALSCDDVGRRGPEWVDDGSRGDVPDAPEVLLVGAGYEIVGAGGEGHCAAANASDRIGRVGTAVGTVKERCSSWSLASG